MGLYLLLMADKMPNDPIYMLLYYILNSRLRLCEPTYMQDTKRILIFPMANPKKNIVVLLKLVIKNKYIQSLTFLYQPIKFRGFV